MKGSEKKKIVELFEYRKLPFLLSYLPKKDSKKLNKKLIKLQHAIYCLDRYLEENWKLKKKKLDSYWKEIYSAMDKLGISPKDSYKMCAHIRKYQKHEVQLRAAKMPTILNSEFYYYYKSCDVRLMRNIIYNLVPDISKDLTLEDWRYFDLITEINDDVEDVFEDQSTINGNMFLISILESGLESTQKDYQEFINETLSKDKKATKEYTDLRPRRKKMHSWTKSEAEKTIKLLHINAKLIEKQGLSPNIPLLKHKVIKRTE